MDTTPLQDITHCAAHYEPVILELILTLFNEAFTAAEVYRLYDVKAVGMMTIGEEAGVCKAASRGLY
jgi:hypothetical protein